MPVSRFSHLSIAPFLEASRRGEAHTAARNELAQLRGQRQRLLELKTLLEA